MKRFVRGYGAGPLHLLATVGSLALAGYVVQFLLASRPVKVGVWFLAAAVLHDVLLVPLYAVADRALVEVWRRSSSRQAAPLPWLNHVRFPAAISLLLLLVFWPEVSRRHTVLTATSRLSTHPYLGHWLLVTGVLFVLSAVSYAVKAGRLSRRTRSAPVAA